MSLTAGSCAWPPSMILRPATAQRFAAGSKRVMRDKQIARLFAGQPLDPAGDQFDAVEIGDAFVQPEDQRELGARLLVERQGCAMAQTLDGHPAFELERHAVPVADPAQHRFQHRQQAPLRRPGEVAARDETGGRGRPQRPDDVVLGGRRLGVRQPLLDHQHRAPSPRANA